MGWEFNRHDTGMHPMSNNHQQQQITLKKILCAKDMNGDGKEQRGAITLKPEEKNLFELNQDNPLYHQEYAVTLTYYKSETHSAIPADESKTFINLSQTTTKILFVFKIYSICSNFNLLWLENMVMDLLVVEGIQCDCGDTSSLILKTLILNPICCMQSCVNMSRLPQKQMH